MKQNLSAALLGILAALALPPVYLLPFAVIGFSGFFLMIITAENLKTAFKFGWWFGFGHFTAGLYWIAFALLVDLSSFGWMIPFALFGIPAVIAFYTGIVAIITRQFTKYLHGWRLVVFFSCVWTIVEMLRGVLFTGFPWNLAGYMWTISDSMLQSTSIAGIWGLSLVTILAFTMPALWQLERVKNADITAHKKLLQTGVILPILLAATLPAVIFLWGHHRLNEAPTKFVPGIKLRLVQANISPNQSWEDEWRYSTVQKYMDMSQSSGFRDITHVIWPETALPFVIGPNSPLLNAVARSSPANGAVITGALRAEYTDTGVMKHLWNSLMVINSMGHIYSYYDKSHLVPFGEYVPFRSILPIEKITYGPIDFAEGDDVRTIGAPGGFPALSGLICYEAIFPGKTVDLSNRPGVLLNITNDAWYGKTSGPYQHFQMARVRAVEEGLPLIRAANNGISAVVDAYGRIVKKTELGTTAVLDSDLPVKISVTTYGRYGDLVILILISVILLTICIRKKYDGKFI